LDRPLGTASAVWLAVALVLFAVVVSVQVVAVTRSPYPRLRAVETLVTSLAMLLLIFSSAYVVIDSALPASFSEELSRTDAVYFAVTVLAAVGFGDIAPVDVTARAVTTVQMVVDLAVVGIVAKISLDAAEAGLRRRGAPP